jgi:hypothetical protein
MEVVDLKYVCSTCNASFASGRHLGAHKVWHCRNLKRKLDVLQEENVEDARRADGFDNLPHDNGFDNLPNEINENPVQVKCACNKIIYACTCRKTACLRCTYFLQEVAIIEKYHEKQMELLDYAKLFDVRCGKSKTSTGELSKKAGDIYDYLQFAQVVETFMLSEKEAEELLLCIKSICHDSVALPSTYKAIRSSIMPALEGRYVTQEACTKYACAY